jgi:condensin-2 complex subunit G2
MKSDETSHNFKVAVKALLKSVEGGSNVEEPEETTYSCKPLIRLFEVSKMQKRLDSLGLGMTPKQQQTLLIETIQNLPKKQANRFFSGLKSNLETIIAEEAYVPASAFQDEEDNRNADEDIKPDKKSTECLHFLKYAAICVEAFLEGRVNHAKERRLSKGMQLPVLPQVYDVAAELHNILFSLHTCGSEGISTQDAVLKVCETWWLVNGVHKETLIAQCLPLLVLKALDDTDFQNSHIKRLFKLKNAFLVIDFTNPSSDSLRSLLLRVASNPLFLRMPEGKKFLACLLQDPDLVKDFHLAFRAQIPETKKSVLQAYGEIYHRAWKDSLDDDSEEVQDAIEHKALQDLMHASIHVSAPATLKSVMTVLETIHNDKKSTHTAELLYRMYNPILWRSLSAANPVVRKNAVVVLEKVFPLHDPTANQSKEAVEKGTAALQSALQDKDPRVRVAAAEATAKICTIFWDALPATEIRMLLNRKCPQSAISIQVSINSHSTFSLPSVLIDIVMGHASDASSSGVRISALEAITKLLEAPQSHAVLRPLLPSLGNLIHDKTERVRLAAVKMLLKIKETRGIRFYHVVPVDHLTSRLSEESRLHENPRNAIAKELTSLLLNSYFPQGSNVSGADQLKRTLTFFMTDPSAAIVFYANLVDLLDEEAVVKFIAMLLACLKSAVDFDQAKKVQKSKKQKKRRRQGSIQQEDDDDDGGNEQNLSASNTALMVALAETLCMLVESVMPLLEDQDNSPCKELLLARFGEIDLINILSHFEQIFSESKSQNDAETLKRNDCLRTYAAILRCIAQLPQDTVDGIAAFIVTSMASFSEENRPLQFILSHLAPLCVWGMTDDVALSLAKSIESAYGNEDRLLSSCSLSLGESIGSRRSSANLRKTSGTVELPFFAPDMALAAINQIMKGNDPPSVFLREEILSSKKASSCIESALEQGSVFAERLFVADTVCDQALTFALICAISDIGVSSL